MSSLLQTLAEAEPNLFAGLLQTNIRTHDDFSAALDWLFACQSCDCHWDLQVRVVDIKKQHYNKRDMASCLYLTNGDFYFEGYEMA